MPAEKKPVSLENIYKKNLEETYGKVPSAEEIYTEGMTAFGESAAAYKKVGEDLDALAAQKKAEKAATQAEQVAFDATRTAGSDRARLAGTSPGTKAAAAMLESVAAGAGAAAGGARPEPAEAAPAPAETSFYENREDLSPEERARAREAALAFDVAFRAIEKEENEDASPVDWVASFLPWSDQTTTAPGVPNGPIARAYGGDDPAYADIQNPDERSRVLGMVREILDEEGGVELWQGTDANDKDAYINRKLIEDMRFGPNEEKVAALYSVFDNATDKQFDASSTLSRLQKAYASDGERTYREKQGLPPEQRLTKMEVDRINADAFSKAAADVNRIKTLSLPHVFVDTGASDLVAKYRKEEGSLNAAERVKARTLDVLGLYPQQLDDIYNQSTGTGKALPGLLIGATVAGRVLEVFSLQEQVAAQVEVFASKVNDEIAKAQDPNAPTLGETASAFGKGAASALSTSVGPWPDMIQGVFGDEDSEAFAREADIRLLEAASDNRDFFDTAAFTLPVLAAAPFGRDAQAEALVDALEVQNLSKLAAFFAAVVLPDTSPLGATASGAAKISANIARSARFRQTAKIWSDIERVVSEAATPSEAIEAAKKVSLAEGMVVESLLMREEARNNISNIGRTLGGLSDQGAPRRGVSFSQAVINAEATLRSLIEGKASPDVINAQKKLIQDLQEKEAAEAEDVLAEKAGDVRIYEDVLDAGLRQTDDEALDEAVGAVAGADKGKVAKLADENEVAKRVLARHPENLRALNEATTNAGASDEQLLRARQAISEIASGERSRVLQQEAAKYEAQAAKQESGSVIDQVKELDALKKVVGDLGDRMAALGKASPEAKAFVDSVRETMKARARATEAEAEVLRLRREVLDLPESQVLDEIKRIEGVDAAQRSAADVDALRRFKAAVSDKGSARVPTAGLFRAQEAAKAANDLLDVATAAQRAARKGLDPDAAKEAISIVVKMKKLTPDGKNLEDVVQEAADKARVASLAKSIALTQKGAAAALRKMDDRATRREILALTRFLAKNPELLENKEVVEQVKDILKRVKLSDAEKADVARGMYKAAGDKVPSLGASLGSLSRGARKVGQMSAYIKWRQMAQSTVTRLKEASEKLAKNNDVSWGDLGWRTGDPRKVVEARQKAGAAVEQALRGLQGSDDLGGAFAAARKALQAALPGAQTKEIDNLAVRMDKAIAGAEDPKVDVRTLQIAAQADIDEAVKKLLSADEGIVLTAMQASWTQRALKYQIKQIMDPMMSYVGTSSQGLRNVYRATRGMVEMYTAGLDGAVRRGKEKIAATVKRGGSETREQVFNVLRREISDFLGSSNVVSERGAAVGGVSIFDRAKRALVTDGPAPRETPALPAEKADLLSAADDKSAVKGMSPDEVAKSTVRLENIARAAQEKYDKLLLKIDALEAKVRDAAAAPPADIDPKTQNELLGNVEDLRRARDTAKQELDEIEGRDLQDFYEGSDLAGEVTKRQAAQDEIKNIVDETKAAKAEVDAAEKQLDALRVQRKGINRKTLGAFRVRQDPENLRSLLSKETAERVDRAEEALASALDEDEVVRAAIRDRAAALPKTKEEITQIEKAAQGARGRLAAAQERLASLGEAAQPGKNSASWRAQKTRAKALVDSAAKEVQEAEDRIQGVIDDAVDALVSSDKKVAADLDRVVKVARRARESYDSALGVADGEIAKARRAPVLASPDEVKAAQKVLDDQIEQVQSTVLAPANKKVSDLAAAQKKAQKIVDDVGKKVDKIINDYAEVAKVLAEIKKKAVAEAADKADKAAKAFLAKEKDVAAIIKAADDLLARREEITEGAKKAQAELNQIKTDDLVAKAEAEALSKKADLDGFVDRVRLERERMAAAAREVAIRELREPGAVGSAQRLAAEEPEELDEVLVRLGMSVWLGLQSAPEALQKAELPGLAYRFAREALSESVDFDDFLGRLTSKWAGKVAASGAVLEQDAKSMVFAAAALVEGAARDVAIDATLREGIALVDPMAAKAMNQIQRVASGGLKMTDLKKSHIEDALLGLLKIGGLIQRTVEGSAATPEGMGKSKAERPLGVALAASRDIQVTSQSVYLPKQLIEGLTTEIDLLRKEADLLPSQSPNTLVNKYLISTARDMMHFMRTTLLIGFGINLLGYRAKTVLGDSEQVFATQGAGEGAQILARGVTQMIPRKGGQVTAAVQSVDLAAPVRRGIDWARTQGLPAPVQAVIEKVGNPVADWLRGANSPTLGKLIATYATSPSEELVLGGVAKTRAEWLEEAARQGAFDNNVEAGLRKTMRDVRDQINLVTTTRMSWAEAKEAAAERGVSPYTLYLQRRSLRGDEVLQRPGMFETARAWAVEHQRALESREADVQRTSRQLMYFRLREKGMSEQEAGEAMRRGLLDWSFGLNSGMAKIVAYLPFWRYHLLSFKQGFQLLFGEGKTHNFDRAQKFLRAYDGFYEGTPSEDEISLIKERARQVARESGRSEEAADLEVSQFLAAKQFAMGNVPRFIQMGNRPYSVEHVSDISYGDLGTGRWGQAEKVDEARRAYRDPEGRTTSWQARVAPRSSIVGALDAAASMSLAMEAAYYYATGDKEASEAALYKGSIPWLDRLPTPVRTMAEQAIFRLDGEVAKAAFAGNPNYTDYGRVSPAEGDLAEMLGIPVINTLDDPRPTVPNDFKLLFSLPILGVPSPLVSQATQVINAVSYQNPYQFDDSSFKKAIATPSAIWGLYRSYGFDPSFNQAMEDAAKKRGADVLIKRAERGTQKYNPR